MRQQIIIFILGFGLLSFATPVVWPDAASVAQAVGRKTVTVYAESEGQAFALAEKQNKGWKAVAAKKVSKDPKSLQWSVTMEQ